MASIKPLLKRVLDIDGLNAKIAGFKKQLDDFNHGDTEHDNLHEYLASGGYDSDLYRLVGEALKAEEAAKYAVEFSLKYIVDHSEYGKAKEIPATVDEMYDYVVRRLTKKGYLPAAE